MQYNGFIILKNPNTFPQRFLIKHINRFFSFQLNFLILSFIFINLFKLE